MISANVLEAKFKNLLINLFSNYSKLKSIFQKSYDLKAQEYNMFGLEK